MNLNDESSLLSLKFKNLPNGGNTIGKEPNGICGIVIVGGDVV